MLAVGVTVTDAVVATVPVLIVANDKILPVPVEASPIVALSLVQVYVVSSTELMKFTSVVLRLLQMVWLEIAERIGVGLTVMLND